MNPEIIKWLDDIINMVISDFALFRYTDIIIIIIIIELFLSFLT
jgi:hypothetical protein